MYVSNAMISAVIVITIAMIQNAIATVQSAMVKMHNSIRCLTMLFLTNAFRAIM